MKLRGDETTIQRRKIVYDRERREPDLVIFFDALREEYFRRLVAVIRELMPTQSTGRPRVHAPATLAAFHLLTRTPFADSGRKAEDWFKYEPFKRDVFEILRQEFPEQYEPGADQAPNRFAYQRIKRRMSWEEAQLIHAGFKDDADAGAREMGLGINRSTRHSPSQESIVYADATWLRSPTRFSSNDRAIDPRTGEVKQRRHDPDATPYCRPTTARHGDAEERDRGNQIAMYSSRHPYAFEEITFDCLPIRVVHGLNELETARAAMRQIRQRHPGMEILVYDKAITGDGINDFRHDGFEVLNAVPDKSRYKTRQSYVGKQKIRGVSVTLVTFESALCVVGNDGEPIKLLDCTGRNLHTRADGTFRTYAEFRIPSNTNCDVRLWGETVTIRADMPKDREKNPKKSKTTNLGDHLRLFPPGSAYYEANHGIRSNSEALNSLVKRHSGPGRRMKSLRFVHQWIDVMTTLAIKNHRAVVQHRQRLERTRALAPPA